MRKQPETIRRRILRRFPRPAPGGVVRALLQCGHWTHTPGLNRAICPDCTRLVLAGHAYGGPAVPTNQQLRGVTAADYFDPDDNRNP